MHFVRVLLAFCMLVGCSVGAYANTHDIKLNNFVVSITEETAPKGGKDFKATYPSKISSVSAQASEYFHVSFDVATVAGGVADVSQSVLRFLHKDTGLEAYFPTRARGGKQALSISIVNEKAFDYTSGTYLLSLFVAGENVSNPIHWEVGEISLTFTEDQIPEKEHLPLYSVELLHESNTAKAPLPVINHQFRVPEKRAPSVLALAFSGVLVFLCIALLGGITKAGGNLKNLSFSLSNLAFLGSLVSILGLYVVFWVQLSLFSTLKTLMPLVVSLVLFGRNALMQRHSTLLKQEGKATKSD